MYNEQLLLFTREIKRVSQGGMDGIIHFYRLYRTYQREQPIQYGGFTMTRTSRLYLTAGLMLLLNVLSFRNSHAAPSGNDILSAMKKATDYMMNTVSYRGGFVWQYSEDLSQQWGEVPARRTQIWVQGATNGVGELLLDAYDATGDTAYLDYAKRTANALIWGQHPAGGWHYFIDFDMTGIRTWYDEIGSKCWGWEEYNHYYGNCTFDDDTTASSIRFLMRLYMTTLDPVYRVPLLKGLDFVLRAQYPNGAWPQRYPLKYEYVKQGRVDYTSFYTYNDGVMKNNIMLLIEAWEKLGNEEYYMAAVRGMDFYIISQGAPPQAGWGDQHYHDLRPAHARTYEPAAVHSRQTMFNIRELQTFYKITGDRRYITPIPSAISWLERSIINTDTSKNYTHHRYYEPVTNKPIYIYREGTSIENGRHFESFKPSEPGGDQNIDIDGMKKEYERVRSLSPDEAQAEYDRIKNTVEKRSRVETDNIEALLSSLNSNGAWITNLIIRNYINPRLPVTIIRGINTRVFISNMKTLVSTQK